jgi:hypothetical protein
MQQPATIEEALASVRRTRGTFVHCFANSSDASFSCLDFIAIKSPFSGGYFLVVNELLLELARLLLLEGVRRLLHQATFVPQDFWYA